MFNRFNKLIQSEGPLIHILYDEMNTLILSLMRRALTEGAIGRKTGKQLGSIDLTNRDVWLPKVDIGEAASREIKAMRESKRISEGSYLAFFKRAKLFYSEAIGKLLKTFPMDNQSLHDLQVLHPLARQSESAK